MGKNIDVTIVTPQEEKSIKGYQGTDYLIINTLLRRGIKSELRILSRGVKNFELPENEELEEVIENIKNIYAGIIRRSLANENAQLEQPLFRGTKISTIERMMKQDKEVSFLSTTTNAYETAKFSKTDGKGAIQERAIALVEGNVPFLNIEELLGGMEAEVLFAPANLEITEGIQNPNVNINPVLGKQYTIRLTPVEIPELSESEVSQLRESVLSKSKEINEILKEIVILKVSTEGKDIDRLNALIEQYSRWKDDMISYCYQEFRKIKKEIETEYTREERIDTQDFTNTGEVKLGGTGEMHLIQDGQGKEYLFKPAVSKFERKDRPYRAEIQEASYKVQKIVNPQGAVKCNTTEINGIFGAIQERIKTSNNGFDLVNWQIEGGAIPQEILDGIMREYVTDYLLCNFDAHSKNFIIGQDGIVRGIDKEQAFRYIREQESKQPSIDYHPNKVYKELEPIYNTIFKRYINGELDINFDVIYDAMHRVEQISSKNYGEIFSRYVARFNSR